MGLHKGKTNNPKGRPAGTPNKVTTATKDWINHIIDKNRKQIEEDLLNMTPDNRVKALFSLLNYIMPKQQSISIDEQTKIEQRALILFLESAPEEAINAIATKVIELQLKNSTANDERKLQHG